MERALLRHPICLHHKKNFGRPHMTADQIAASQTSSEEEREIKGVLIHGALPVKKTFGKIRFFELQPKTSTVFKLDHRNS